MGQSSSKVEEQITDAGLLGERLSCSNCGKESEPGKALQRCSACQSVHYCSKECQVKSVFKPTMPVLGRPRGEKDAPSLSLGWTHVCISKRSVSVSVSVQVNVRRRGSTIDETRKILQCCSILTPLLGRRKSTGQRRTRISARK